ncbi:MAG: ribosome maturation factor RimP [Gammaproteobacteria bacterium]
MKSIEWALGPFFVREGQVTRLNHSTRKEQLIELLEPPLEALGYELVDLESRTGHDGLLRIYIDSESGIDLDDCERVSHQISAVLDVEDPIPGRYALEVSSPGLDRSLRKREHFELHRDEVVNVRLDRARDGRRNFKGRLVSVSENEIVVEVDTEHFALALADVQSAQLVAEL